MHYYKLKYKDITRIFMKYNSFVTQSLKNMKQLLIELLKLPIPYNRSTGSPPSSPENNNPSLVVMYY